MAGGPGFWRTLLQRGHTASILADCVGKPTDNRREGRRRYGTAFYSGWLRSWEGRAMGNNRVAITIPADGYAAILDAVQRAVIDRYASKATRKAAFSALLALIEAGAVVGDTAIDLPTRDASGSAVSQTKARLRLTG